MFAFPPTIRLRETACQCERGVRSYEKLEKGFTSQFSISDEELIAKASYFILSQKLIDKKDVNYKCLLKKTDSKILKDFINSVSSNFCIKNGRIESITFNNGIIHEFVYKDK